MSASVGVRSNRDWIKAGVPQLGRVERVTTTNAGRPVEEVVGRRGGSARGAERQSTLPPGGRNGMERMPDEVLSRVSESASRASVVAVGNDDAVAATLNPFGALADSKSLLARSIFPDFEMAVAAKPSWARASTAVPTRSNASRAGDHRRPREVWAEPVQERKRVWGDRSHVCRARSMLSARRS